MTQIKSVSKAKAFQNYAWLLLVPAGFMSVVGIIAQAYFIIPVVVILFSFVALINFRIKGMTNYVNIGEDKLVVDRSQIFEFNYEHLTTQPVVERSWWKGLLIQNEAGQVTIWKHEFDKADWEKIKNEISSKIGQTL